MAAPMGIQMVLSVIFDDRHICMAGRAIIATIAGRAPRKNPLQKWL